MNNYKIIDNLIPHTLCRHLIEISEAKGYDEADISYEAGPKMNKEYRNNSRCLYSDSQLTKDLQDLLEPHIPKEVPFIREGGIFERVQFSGLSNRLRFYRYYPGEQFKKHRDSNAREENGVSLITVLFYLNTPEEGGETFICDRSLDYQPKVEAVEGRVLLFNHSLLHTGEPLIKGVKYVLRSDLVYMV